MRIGEGNVGTHVGETVSEKHTGFVHPVVAEGNTFGLSGENDERTHGVGGKTRPRTSLKALDERGFLISDLKFTRMNFKSFRLGIRVLDAHA